MSEILRRKTATEEIIYGLTQKLKVYEFTDDTCRDFVNIYGLLSNAVLELHIGGTLHQVKMDTWDTFELGQGMAAMNMVLKPNMVVAIAKFIAENQVRPRVRLSGYWMNGVRD